MERTVLVIGADGMLGHRVLRKFLDVPGYVVHGTVRGNPIWLNDMFAGGKSELRMIGDVEASDAVRFNTIFEMAKPKFVVNCIGIIKQRLTDANDPVKMVNANSLLPHNLAGLCARFDAKLVTFSSDCVFLGNRNEPYTEIDPPDAWSIYGKTKALGEVDGQRHVLTLRTSFIGHEIKGFTSLLEWFLATVRKQKETGEEIRGFRSAMWSGVTTKFIAELMEKFAWSGMNVNGLYHLAGSPINKYDLLNLISETLGLGARIVPDDRVVPDKVCRRVLRGDMFEEDAGITVPVWRELIGDLSIDHEYYTGKTRPCADRKS